MAALSKRDIEMIFRAETDAAQRPVKELGADVRKLRGTLEDLAKASDKTEKSLDDLAATTTELSKAQAELSNARTLLTQLNAQAGALERAEEKAGDAAKKYNDLKTAQDAAEKVTKRQVQTLEAAERRMNSTSEALVEQKRQYADIKGSIESIIGPVDNLQDAFRTVAVAQREVTQGLAQTKDVAAGINREIAQSGTQAAIDIRTEEQVLAAARKNDALEETARKNKQRDEIERLLQGNAALEQQFVELAEAEQRMAQVDAFRKMAADSVAATSAAQRVENTLQGSTTSAQRLAVAIAGIIDPAQAAGATLAGVDERLDAVLAKMAGKKINTAEWGQLNNELQSIQASLIRTSAEVDKFTAQQARVDGASAAYDRQAQKVRALATAEVTASTDVKKLSTDLAREEALLTALGLTLDADTKKLREFSEALRQVGVDSGKLPAAISKIENSAKRAAPAIQKVRDVVTPGGKGGFLGLDPYQLQNLGYQVNDVFTSLGSGAPPLQVLAQQSGQILQIFPGIFASIMSLLPVLAPLAAGFVLVAAAMSEANDQIKTLRTANTVIASLADNNGYDSKKFRQIVEDFRDMGVSIEDATASAKIFVTEGLNPKALDDYIVAAKNLADVNKIDVKTATDELTKAFTAGATEVLALDDKYHFLTDTQRTNLEASKDTKNEYNEVNKAFSSLYKKMQEGANAARGPMTDSTNTLRGAWRSLIETFADTGALEKFNALLGNTLIGLSAVINFARRAGAIFKDYNTGDAITALKSVYNNYQAAGGIDGLLKSSQEDTFAQMRASRAALTRPQGNPLADAGAGSSGRQKNREEQAKKDRKQAATDAKKAAREAEAEAKRRLAEAKALEKQYQNEQDQLSQSLSRYTVEAMKGTEAPLEQQLSLAKQSVDEQFKAVEDRLAEFRDKFGSGKLINGMTQKDFASNLDVQKAQITLSKQLGVYESNVNDLLKSRGERLKSIEEDQKSGLLSAQEALDKTKEVTSDVGPKLDAAIFSARTFIAALTPSAATQALLDKFDRIRSENGSDEQDTSTITRASAKTGLATEEQKINDIFERRGTLIDAANRLYEIGSISYEEREQRAKAAFSSTDEALRAQIETMKQFVITNKALFPPGTYELALAQLEEYNSKLKYTDQLTTAVKGAAEQAFANGFVNMFDTLAQGIANVITGAGSLKDLFGDLGLAALNFAADFMKAIAQAIVQIYALRIAKSLIGGFHGGGTVGSYGNGQMRLSRNIGGPDLSAVPRYHQGTQGAGLKSNEMLAVLEKGEKVQTEEQQRSAKRQLDTARKGGQSTGLRQVLAFGDDQVAAAMQGTGGERVIVTHLKRNIPLLKQWLKS